MPEKGGQSRAGGVCHIIIHGNARMDTYTPDRCGSAVKLSLLRSDATVVVCGSLGRLGGSQQLYLNALINDGFLAARFTAMKFFWLSSKLKSARR